MAGERILLLSDANSPHTQKWANNLYDLGAEVAVFSFVEQMDCTYPNVLILQSGTPPDSLDELNIAADQMRKIYRQWRPTILHAHYLTSYGILAFLSKRPYFLSVWGKDIYRLQGRARNIRQHGTAAINSAKLVCSTSHCMAVETRARTNARIEIVPFGVDIDYFKPGIYDDLNIDVIKPGWPMVSVTKWMDDKKYGQSVLVRAAAILKTRDIDIRVALTGGESDDTLMLKGLAGELGVVDRIWFTGRLNRKEIRSLLSQCAVVAFPSLLADDSFSVSTVEASAMGKPVVASHIGGLAETVVNALTGLHFETGNAEQMADRLQKILSDSELRERYGRQGRKFVEDNYDIKQNVRRMVDLYKIYK